LPAGELNHQLFQLLLPPDLFIIHSATTMPAIITLVLLFLQALFALASPSRLEDRAELPVIELPQGSFRAARYNKANDVYVLPDKRRGRAHNSADTSSRTFPTQPRQQAT
jgi:hypothetical protein